MFWISSRRIFFGAALLVGLASCSPKSSVPVGPLAQPYDDAEGSVQFDIKPLEGKPGAARWAATYSARGKTAKFRVELAATTPAKETDFPFSIGKGRILSEPGSNASILLVDLKKALEAKTIPTNVGRVASLPFEFVILGKEQLRSSDGSFSGNPAGEWVNMKIFLAGDQSEVFLNLNPTTNKGEFSIKDVDYGDIVIAELAKVL
jgi:hypothetical protein